MVRAIPVHTRVVLAVFVRHHGSTFAQQVMNETGVKSGSVQHRINRMLESGLLRDAEAEDPDAEVVGFLRTRRYFEITGKGLRLAVSLGVSLEPEDWFHANGAICDRYEGVRCDGTCHEGAAPKTRPPLDFAALKGELNTSRTELRHSRVREEFLRNQLTDVENIVITRREAQVKSREVMGLIQELYAELSVRTLELAKVMEGYTAYLEGSPSGGSQILREDVYIAEIVWDQVVRLGITTTLEHALELHRINANDASLTLVESHPAEDPDTWILGVSESQRIVRTARRIVRTDLLRSRTMVDAVKDAAEWLVEATDTPDGL